MLSRRAARSRADPSGLLRRRASRECEEVAVFLLKRLKAVRRPLESYSGVIRPLGRSSPRDRSGRFFQVISSRPSQPALPGPRGRSAVEIDWGDDQS